MSIGEAFTVVAQPAPHYRFEQPLVIATKARRLPHPRVASSAALRLHVVSGQAIRDSEYGRRAKKCAGSVAARHARNLDSNLDGNSLGRAAGADRRAEQRPAVIRQFIRNGLRDLARLVAGRGGGLAIEQRAFSYNRSFAANGSSCGRRSRAGGGIADSRR